jgi:hypothetical protein
MGSAGESHEISFLAAIFGITGGVAILLAVPAEERAPVIKIQLPKSWPDYGEPLVPQIEEMPPQEMLLPEPSDHYSVAQASTKNSRGRTCTWSGRNQTSSRN